MLEDELKVLTVAVVALTKAIYNMGLNELPKVVKETEPEAEQVAVVAPVKSTKADSKKVPEKDEDPADIKYDTIKTAILELVEKAGRDAAVGVLAEFKLKSAVKAKPAQYPKLLAAINRELKEIT